MKRKKEEKLQRAHKHSHTGTVTVQNYELKIVHANILNYMMLKKEKLKNKSNCIGSRFAAGGGRLIFIKECPFLTLKKNQTTRKKNIQCLVFHLFS